MIQSVVTPKIDIICTLLC